LTVSAEFRAAQALGVSSATRLKKAPVTNPDTSADVYFGPTVPAGHEANWVQTIPGKGWNVLLRLYGPLQPWYEKTWRPGEMSVLARHRRLQEKGGVREFEEPVPLGGFSTAPEV
jgi:hypothetical protein